MRVRPWIMAGDSLERKSLIQVLWPHRKLRKVWDTKDARTSGINFRGVVVE